MNIAILGYGKMGREIEKISIKRGHNIVLKTNSKSEMNKIDFSNVDVAIEFSKPESALNNIIYALNKSIPVISGTTGWVNKKKEFEKITKNNQTAFMHASNFSIGVNLFFALNKRLNELMNNQNEYTPSIEEIHHIHKIDSPSGTALNLSKEFKNKIDIKSVRQGEVYGVHIVNFKSQNDSLQIKHEAHNRHGFAIGAVLAAEWIKNKIGVFTINEMLNIKNI